MPSNQETPRPESSEPGDLTPEALFSAHNFSIPVVDHGICVAQGLDADSRGSGAEPRTDLRWNHRNHDRGTTSGTMTKRATTGFLRRDARPEVPGLVAVETGRPRGAQGRETMFHAHRARSGMLFSGAERAVDGRTGLQRDVVPARRFQSRRRALSARLHRMASRGPRRTAWSDRGPAGTAHRAPPHGWSGTAIGAPPRVRVHVPASRTRASGLDPPLRESLTLLPRGWGYGSALGTSKKWNHVLTCGGTAFQDHGTAPEPGSRNHDTLVTDRTRCANRGGSASWFRGGSRRFPRPNGLIEGLDHRPAHRLRV